MEVTSILDEMDAPKKRILDALAKSKGIVSSACDAADIPRSTFYNWCKNDEAFKAAVDDVQDIALDYVEGQLFKLIEGSDTAATIFFMKTRGKKRGYIERTELTGADGKDLNYNVTLDLGGNTKHTIEPVSGREGE